MTSEFKSGVKSGLMLYGIGALITCAVHFVSGWDYAHAPPMSALPLLITLVIGAFRLISTAFKTLVEKSGKAQGELIVHVCIALIIALLLLWP